MSNTKKTQRALVSSAIAILLCFAMLIGTTFAWFTDSKSTTVNSIDSGNLHVALLDQNGADATGRPLNWVTADGRTQDKILWEPGCTYDLEPVTIANTGALALKYTVEISGILSNDQFLNSAIDWTITVNGNAVNITEFEGWLLPGETNSSDTLTISGHMREDAGNEYQDQSITGVAIKVVATQLPHEYDSYGKDYDETADYPITEITIDGVDFYVLKTEGTKMLLLTKENVAVKTFSENDGVDEVKSEWRTSDLRTYLNGEWLNNYPTLSALASETTLYTETKDSVYSDERPVFYTTADKVFLLSEADVNGTSFCDINEGTGDKVTDSRFYTYGSQLTPPDGSWKTSTDYGWWLRSPSHWGYTVAYLDNESGHAQGQSWACGGIGVRPALWVDYFANDLAVNGSVNLTEDKTVASTINVATPEITITASEPVTLSSATGLKSSVGGMIHISPSSVEGDTYTVNLGDNVTIANASGTNSSGIVLGDFGVFAEGKTLNVNGGNFYTVCGGGSNGAIVLTALRNCTVNITGTSFTLGMTNASKQQYGSAVSLSTYPVTSDVPEGSAVYDTTVNFINCTFYYADGTEISQDVLPSLTNALYGFGGNNNTYNFINN